MPYEKTDYDYMRPWDDVVPPVGGKPGEFAEHLEEFLRARKQLRKSRIAQDTWQSSNIRISPNEQHEYNESVMALFTFLEENFR